MAISRDGVARYRSDYSQVFSAVCAAAQAEGMKVKFADPAGGSIALSISVSWRSWGETVNVRVWQEDAGTVAVGVDSALKFGLVDWGKNKRNLEKLFARTEEMLTGGAVPLGDLGNATPTPTPTPAPASVPAGWHPDPNQRHQFRYWDGTRWTAHVSDDGAVSSDPA